MLITARPLLRAFVRMPGENKPDELKKLLAEGVVPIERDTQSGVVPSNKRPKPGDGTWKEKRQTKIDPTYGSMLVGQAVGGIKDILPAKQILEEMMSEAMEVLQGNQAMIGAASESALAPVLAKERL